MKRSLFSLFALISLFAIGQANGYCAIRNSQLYTRISKATILANHWLLNEQGKDGKWHDVHTTGNVIATLAAIGHSPAKVEPCKDIFKKATNYFSASKGVISQSHGGRLAYIVMGLNALCKDPRNYNEMNLIDRLLEDLKHFPKGSFNHPFHYALAVIALGINNERIPKQVFSSLMTQVALRNAEIRHEYTSAMMVMALASVYNKQVQPKIMRTSILKAMTKLVSKLGGQLMTDKDNIYTKSLILQAFAAVDGTLPWHHSKCEAVYASLLRAMKSNGSFGGISANLHVLPALVGASYLDLKNSTHCISEKKGQENEKHKRICVKVEFESDATRNPPQQRVVVAEGSTALDALKAASLSDTCYKVETTTSSVGQSINSICKQKINHLERQYWIFYIDGKMATTGIDSYIPKTNECVIMRFENMDSTQNLTD